MRRKSKTEGTCIHVQLIHFAIQQKRTQHCNNCTPIKINLKRVTDPQLQCGRRNRTIRSGVLRMKSHGSDQGHSPINTSVSVVKNPPAGEETQIRSLGREDPLEKEMDTHFSILAWEIPWTEEPGGPQSTSGPKHEIHSSLASAHLLNLLIT